jgi:hypothetical protein
MPRCLTGAPDRGHRRPERWRRTDPVRAVSLLADARVEGRETAFSLHWSGRRDLATHDPKVRDSFRRALAHRGIELHERQPVQAVMPGAILLKDEQTVKADAVLVTTGGRGAAWFRARACSRPDGFPRVAPSSDLNDPDVFAAGIARHWSKRRERRPVCSPSVGPRSRATCAGWFEVNRWDPGARSAPLGADLDRRALCCRIAWRIQTEGLVCDGRTDRRRWIAHVSDTNAMLARMPKPRPAPTRKSNAMRRLCRQDRTVAVVASALKLPRDRGRRPGGVGDARRRAILQPPTSGYLVQTVDFFRLCRRSVRVRREFAAPSMRSSRFGVSRWAAFRPQRRSPRPTSRSVPPPRSRGG